MNFCLELVISPDRNRTDKDVFPFYLIHTAFMHPYLKSGSLCQIPCIYYTPILPKANYHLIMLLTDCFQVSV